MTEARVRELINEDVDLDLEGMKLGRLIQILEAVPIPYRKLPYGIGKPHSHRWKYENLGFNLAEDIDVGEMLANARAALGETFEGWKGGTYTMTADTPCYLTPSYGESGYAITELGLLLMLGIRPFEMDYISKLDRVRRLVNPPATSLNEELLDRLVQAIETA